jgi:hypothetical protein
VSVRPHSEEIVGDLLDVRRNRVAVHPAVRGERLEHEQGEGALEDVVLALRHRILGIYTCVAMHVKGGSVASRRDL